MQRVIVPDGHDLTKDMLQKIVDTDVDSFQTLITDLGKKTGSDIKGIVSGGNLSVVGATNQMQLTNMVAYVSSGDRLEVYDALGYIVLTVSGILAFSDGKLVVIEIDPSITDDSPTSINPVTGEVVKYVSKKRNNYKPWSASTHLLTIDGYNNHSNKGDLVVVGKINSYDPNVVLPNPQIVLDSNAGGVYRTQFSLGIGTRVITDENISPTAQIDESKVKFKDAGGHDHTGTAGKGTVINYNSLSNKPSMTDVSQITRETHSTGLVSLHAGESSTSLKCSIKAFTTNTIAVTDLKVYEDGINDVVYVRGKRIEGTGNIDPLELTISGTSALYYIVLQYKEETIQGVVRGQATAKTSSPTKDEYLLATTYWNGSTGILYQDENMLVQGVIDKRLFGTIGREQIQSLEIQTSDLANDSITVDKLANDSVTVDKLAHDIDASGIGFKAASAVSVLSGVAFLKEFLTLGPQALPSNYTPADWGSGNLTNTSYQVIFSKTFTRYSANASIGYLDINIGMSLTVRGNSSVTIDVIWEYQMPDSSWKTFYYVNDYISTEAAPETRNYSKFGIILYDGKNPLSIQVRAKSTYEFSMGIGASSHIIIWG